MQKLSELKIHEIAEQLDCGNRSFIHKTTGELLFIPDFDNNPFSDTEFYADEIEKLDSAPDEYIEIPKPDSSESFEIMAKFTERLELKNPVKIELLRALAKKKPFREFKFAIDRAGEYRQEWFIFKMEKLKRWVENKFNEKTLE